MQLKTEVNTYLSLKDDYGKFINFQCLIIGASGWGKGLVTSGMLSRMQEDCKAIILCISDCKNEFELAYAMFEPREKYHLDHLRKIGKKPGKKNVKLYHPFTFSIPTNLIPEINFYTFSLKDLGRKEWGLIAETEWSTETISTLLQASQNISKNDGLYSFMNYVQNAVKGKKIGKTKKPDSKNFYLETGTGSMKAVSEISRHLQSFRQHYFLSSDSCPLKLDWKKLLTDQENYHVFLYNWIDDEKIKDFTVLALLEGVLRNKQYLKNPVVIAIPEIRKQCPFRPMGHKQFLSISIKDSLALMRSSGKGMSSILDSQVWSDISEEVRNSANVTLFGKISGGGDMEKIAKAFNYKRDIRTQLSSPDYLNSYLLVGKEDMGGITPFFPEHMWAEPHYRFTEIYKQECPEKMRDYKDIIEMMRKDLKDEENKIKDKIKKQDKRDKEEKERLAKEKESNSLESKFGEDKDKKIQELKDQSKLEKMKRCWEFRKENPELSLRKSAKKLGFPESSGNKTFKKYVDQYQEILDKEKEKEDDVDYEDKVLSETKIPDENPLLGEEFDLPEIKDN